MRRLFAVVLALTLSACAAPAPAEAPTTTATSSPTVTAEGPQPFYDRGTITSSPAPEVTPTPTPEPAPEPPAPAPKPEPVEPEPAPVPPPAKQAPVQVDGHIINVVGVGGQAAIDACVGPIKFEVAGLWETVISEHDYCGGWERFSTVESGDTVTLTGAVNGTYTAGQPYVVPQLSRADVLQPIAAATLQTCIPGTSDMILVPLY